MRLQRRITALALSALVAGACAHGLGDVRADVQRPQGSHHLELRGDGAMLNMARRVSEQYMKDHDRAVVTVSGGGSRRGIKSLLQGTADIALVTGEVPPDLQKLANERRIKLERQDVFQDAVCVVVHKQNSVENLALWQVRDIYKGDRLTNWKDVGGKDAPIKVLTFEATLGVYDTFKRSVLGSGAVIDPKATVVKWTGFKEAMTENAIAYIGVHGLTQAPASQSKPVFIDGVDPRDTDHLIAKGYPIRRMMSIMYRGDPPLAVQSLVGDFLSPYQGQRIVRELHDIPVK